MLDEALEVLVGLWSGEEYSFLGEFYHINKVCFLPKPLQEPRIPIWVGGVWPNKTPFQRAIKWDGAFPYFFTDTEEQEFRQLEDSVRYLKKINDFNHPFEIICAGVTPDADSDKTISIIKQRKSLGVTWWLESINPLRFNKNFESDWPINALRDRILHGPPLDP